MNSEIFKPSLLPDKDKTEFVKQVQQEYKHIGSIKYRSGSTLWQFNTETGELKPAKIIVKEQLVWTSKGDCTKKTRSVIYEDKCVYMWALNRKNAEKKILKVINNVIRKKTRESMIVHFIILWFAIALLIVLVMFLVDSIGYMYYHRMEMVWYIQMMIALVLSLFILGGIVLIAFSIESFCSVVSLLQDASVTALSLR